MHGVAITPIPIFADSPMLLDRVRLIDIAQDSGTRFWKENSITGFSLLQF